MSYLAFEHAIAVKNPIKRELMKLGSGGEIVHVEFILPTFHNLRASSWNGFGVGLKTEQVNFSEFVVYDLGNFDQAIYDYFKDREGQKYDIKGLFTTMILKMNPVEKDRFFCSEIVVEVLQNIVGLKLPPLIPSQVSPHKLYQIISQMGLAQTNL
jgi:hypothetical protein